jgi:hypothetical protein
LRTPQREALSGGGIDFRRESLGVLQKLCGGVWSSSPRRSLGCIVEERDHCAVWRLGAECMVARAKLRLLDELRRSTMQPPPGRGRQPPVDRHREQRVREAKEVLLVHDYGLGLDGGVDERKCPLDTAERRRECRNRRAFEHGNQLEQGKQPLRQALDAASHEFLQRRRNRQRATRARSCRRSPELEREHRVSAGRPLDATEEQPREPQAEPKSKQTLQGADAQRRELELVEPPTVAFCEPHWVGDGGAPAKRRQCGNAALTRPPQNEGENPRRRAVNPLCVIDCNEERASLGEQPKGGKHGPWEKQGVGRYDGRATERGAECKTLRLRQVRSNARYDLVEKIREHRESELHLRLDAARTKNANASRGCCVNSFLPQGRLAHPSFATDQDGARALREGRDLRDALEFLIPPDELKWCCDRHARIFEHAKRGFQTSQAQM